MTITRAAWLGRYEEMQRISQNMLDAARKGEWDRLVQLEQSRAGVEKDLRQGDQSAWDGKHAARKAELIRSILDADNETRRLTQAWMAEMQKSLKSISTGKKLKQAYEQA
ncbi:MAG TPA: flagellar protein FliT [Noviherbaspirillum sp.]|uniref:flagellar protein FliT n=1 Tax=Noviherbaspirillum sp. TaxID=1926288 RepID=UPI002B4A68A0|nr:flagellar protein FliT [Noviherbaspirillum sp.]HJV88520.1 flagellar protein FliT [Noviherbaspirillum sp.]